MKPFLEEENISWYLPDPLSCLDLHWQIWRSLLHWLFIWPASHSASFPQWLWRPTAATSTVTMSECQDVGGLQLGISQSPLRGSLKVSKEFTEKLLTSVPMNHRSITVWPDLKYIKCIFYTFNACGLILTVTDWTVSSTFTFCSSSDSQEKTCNLLAKLEIKVK